MNATFTWSCNGFNLSGVKAGPLRTALKAIREREASRKLDFADFAEPPDEILDLEGELDENSGLFVDLLVLELGVQRCFVKVEIATGHLLEHDCGAYFSAETWNELPDGTVRMRSFVTGRLIVLVGKTCTCGRAASFQDLELIHVEDVCNSNGGDA